MNTRRMTIARWMSATAVFGLNGALLRAFLVQEMFWGGIVMMLVLQVGLWRLLRARGRRRHFWMGFEVCGAIAVLVMFSADLFPGSPQARFASWYIECAMSLVNRLPQITADRLEDFWGPFLAIVFSVPEFAVALLGGFCAAFASKCSSRARVGRGCLILSPVVHLP